MTYEHTLMPIKMNARYDVDELGENYLTTLRLTLLKGFAGITYSGGEKYKVCEDNFGHLLF